MTAWQIALAIILIIISIIIVVVVLLQKNRQASISGVIAGGDSDDSSFFGKTKGHQKDSSLELSTVISGVALFVITIIAFFLLLFLR